MKTAIITLWLSLAAIIMGCAHIVPSEKMPEKKPLYLVQKEFHRGLWVRAVSTASPDSITRIIQIAEKLGVTDIYVQVVVAGYAYYDSQLLPRSQYLSEVSGSQYDPLAALIKAVKNRPIRIHAWVNALLVWSLKEQPDSARHVLYTHPEWFISDINRTSMADYSHEEWSDLGLEGLYLNPALPEVQEHMKNIGREIVSNYPVAGVHLDFIRYPGTFWGLPDNDTSALFAGLDGYTLRWLNLTRYPQLPFPLRWKTWHYWKINEQREKALFHLIEGVRSIIREDAVNPKCVLTAAVFSNPSTARFRFAQNWIDWGETLDYPVVMSYTQDILLFSDILEFTHAHRSDAVFGIGFLWPDMEDEAYWQVKEARKNNAHGICFFDYTALDTMVEYERISGKQTVETDSLFKDTSRYEPVTGMFIEVPEQMLIEKGRDMLVSEEDIEFTEYLYSLSLDLDKDLMRMDLSRDRFHKGITDDIAAFKYLDSVIFPLSDQLVEPPQREVDYEFLPWGAEDSAVVIGKAQKMKKLTQHAMVYPDGMDRLARAAFNAEPGKKETCVARNGVYVFEVTEIHKGGKNVARDSVENSLLPIYVYWTMRDKINRTLYR